MKGLLILLLGAAAMMIGSTSAQTNGTCTPGAINYPPKEDFDRWAMEDKVFYVQEIFAVEAGHTSEPRWECFALYLTDIWNIDGMSHFWYEIFTNVADAEAGYHYSNRSTCSLVDGNAAVWNAGWFDPRRYDTTVITHTDYETYGVIHYCPEPSTMRNKYERFYTFTSSPTPSESLLGDLRTMVADVGFPTEFGMKISHHADCDYGYNYVSDDGQVVDKDDFDG